MRYAGIDYGAKRVGVAFSDESGSMAFPHAVIHNDPALLPSLLSLFAERDVAAVVVGHSLNRDGTNNRVQSAVGKFVRELTAAGMTVHLEPEQYTTQEAIRLQGRTDLTDASAAALILSSFLSKRKI